VSHRNDRTLAVRALARVEGEGAMHVRVREGAVEDVRLEIYEPPRFFEAFLRGRQHTEPPDITARICGICPVAYQMSACAAIEAACGIEVTAPIADLRRLLYCGEWIESHALHIYLLHAPDFLGHTSALALAEDRRDLVERGLALKKAGNAIMELVGGRAIHPVNVRVGGFYRAPAKSEMTALAEKLRVALDQALDTVRWAAGFEFPDFHHDHEMLALVTPGQYAIDRGTVATTGGLTFAPAEFEDHVIEEHVPHSTALHARLAGRGRYLTGPTARYNLSRQWLSPVARQAADEAGLGAECRNPYRSILVRAVEVVYAVDEALRLIERYEPPAPCHVDVPPRAATGHGATEAPRGVLFHRFAIDAEGLITSARIVPPTSQNQASIEDDLRRFVAGRLDLDDQHLTWQCEQAIRNYDPCISCATHFLDLTVDRALPGTGGAVGGLHRADVAFALIGGLVGSRGQGEHSAHRGDRRISLAGHPAGQAVEQDGGVPGAVPDQRGRRHHDIGARQQVLDHVGWSLDAGRRGEGGAQLLAQDGDPGARQPGLGRAGEVHVRQHREGLGVDVGLQEPVEQHQAVRARLVKPQCHLADRAEVRAQLDRHRHGHRVLDPAQDVDMPLLDLAAGDARVAWYVVDVQLDRRGARVLHRPRVTGPAAGRYPVDAADDRYVDRRRGALE
jgi:sulfhydrogenase subunit alpha